MVSDCRLPKPVVLVFATRGAPSGRFDATETVMRVFVSGFGLEEQHWHADEVTDLIRSATVE
jgi:hypothetical protein